MNRAENTALRNRKIVGIGAMLAALVICVSLIFGLRLETAPATFQSPAIFEFMGSCLVLIAGIYVGLYFIAGKPAANTIGIAFLIFFLVCFAIGAMRIEIQPFPFLLGLVITFVISTNIRSGVIRFNGKNSVPIYRRENPKRFWRLITIYIIAIILLFVWAFWPLG